MLSLKELFRSGKPTPADFTRSIQTVLTGASRCTLSGREEELSNFRESILALAGQINEHSTTTQMEAAVGHALSLLQQCNDEVIKFNRLHINELKLVMRTMTETITYLSESRTRSVHQLQFMERELEQASEIDDIRLLRARLVTCLDLVKEETVRLQSESDARSTEVRQEIARTPKAYELPRRFGAMDAVTGLPARRPAERSLTEAIAQGNDHAAAVFVVNGLAAVNSKYGRAVGDEVMLRVANHFAKHLPAATQLYRWSGPALVALTPAVGNADEIKRLWSKTAAAKQEINLELRQRTVFVLVETRMSFHLATRATQPEVLFQSLDQFVDDHAIGATEDAALPG